MWTHLHWYEPFFLCGCNEMQKHTRYCIILQCFRVTTGWKRKTYRSFQTISLDLLAAAPQTRAANDRPMKHEGALRRLRVPTSPHVYIEWLHFRPVNLEGGSIYTVLARNCNFSNWMVPRTINTFRHYYCVRTSFDQRCCSGGALDIVGARLLPQTTLFNCR